MSDPFCMGGSGGSQGPSTIPAIWDAVAPGVRGCNEALGALACPSVIPQQRQESPGLSSGQK